MAREYAEIGVAMKREQGHLEAMAEGLLWLGHAWLGLNQPEKAAVAYRESLTVRQKLDLPHLVVWVKSGLARVAVVQGNLTAALDYVNEIVSYLANGESLLDTWEPLRIYLICYQVLQLAGDSRAEEIIKTAFNLLQNQAARITDPTYRSLFLENIPWHREIIEAWESRQA